MNLVEVENFPDHPPSEEGWIWDPEARDGSVAVAFTQPEDLLEAEEIVTELETVRIRIEYPLHNPTTFQVQNPGGFKAKDLLLAVRQAYETVYKTEEDDVGAETGTVHPQMLNRATSSGRYGIWGHYMTDLFLERVLVYDNGDIVLGMGS